ncbi:TetR/AcrR family transcriptional regulator [Streptomyces sp. AJS327]|uniref:TetR family transcriptional regulator n=1 Tax=Streptomyces sp. AJS327 TaxID=2545265 RepID=UPI0015E01C0B|nr:TetR family transcriptional regulator [Streptomyces sp. AJS327]MBA0050901.1 TetR/AcrR family transcriptional regulator [Streptomyces sp. AJS327]
MREAIRAPKAQERRLAKIVETGTRLFDERGFGGTTMDDVAASVGITKRTLYRYVASKPQLLLLIHERFLEAAERTVGDADSDVDVVTRLDNFLRAYLSVIIKRQRSVRVFFEEEYHLDADDRSTLVGRRDELEARLRVILRDGAGEGRLRSPDAAVVAAGIFGALASAYQWFRPRGHLTGPQVTKQVTALLLSGLRSGEAFAEPPATDGAGWSRLAPAAPANKSGGEPPRVPAAALRAAARLFATAGFSETSTQQIADAAGVNKSALFYHIGSKEDLLFAIHHEFAMASLANLDRWREEAGHDPERVLRHVIARHAVVMSTEWDSVRVFVGQSRYLSRPHAQVIEELRARYVGGVAEIVEAGQRLGIFRDLDSRVTALTTLGALNWMARWFDPSGRVDAATAGAMYADMFLNGLVVPVRVTAP